MRTSTTNRLLTKTLRTFCCLGALTACSAWATVVTWNPNDVLSAGKDLSQPAYTATARGTDASSPDSSHQYSFQSVQSAGATEVSSTSANDLKNKMQAVTADIPQESRSISSTRPDESLFFAASDAPTRSTTELDEAMAKTFDEEFVSVPSVQFASTATAAQAATISAANAGPGPVPVPEMSAFFPIVGLIAAVSCTRILRRRRAAQVSASRQ